MELTPELFLQIYHLGYCSASKAALDGTPSAAFLSCKLKRAFESMQTANGERPKEILAVLKEAGADVPPRKEDGELWKSVVERLLLDVEYRKLEVAANQLLARRDGDKRKAIDEFKGLT